MPLRYHDQRHRHKLKSRGLNFERVPDAQSVPKIEMLTISIAQIAAISACLGDCKPTGG